ncbi:LacI family DNA-binding transcriptional regulator [Sphingomonas sp. BIUV-7]|uniref:LacI family DNA-binding transcriptional regulator n=1 Tax=Sphingomonas natans TaxID=3063330 RepID=A0ABT8YBU0_9SPHN|nr:LacI family DNA-binding transcriptional regulator [Sphingomonas sp. BIUV-7]MDO6415184.1 LacI family DNA-binding transcriptional regulator [Sphingomonas sp. BIUV-7]
MTEAKTSRRRRVAPTINDVAKRAGVSSMTVSRVINGEANVRESTRETVNAAIAALNYAPNPAARSLAGAGQVRIGLLYSNPSAAYLSEFLVGGLDQASRSDAQIVVEKCEIGDHEVAAAQHLIAGGIDGIILPPPICDSRLVLEVLQKAGIPTVVVATGSPPDKMLAVTIDDRDAARAMTRHLMALGHRRIGFVMGNPNQTGSALRLEGYQSALAEAGLTADPELIAPGLYTYRSGLDAADQLLGLDKPPTAVFAANDDMAAAVIAVAHRRGLDVPGDLSVCGFDDTALATAIWPELTTIHQPIAEMSRASVELLITAIRQKGRLSETGRHLVLDYTLIRRHSDAPPRRRPRARP